MIITLKINMTPPHTTEHNVGSDPEANYLKTSMNEVSNLWANVDYPRLLTYSFHERQLIALQSIHDAEQLKAVRELSTDVRPSKTQRLTQRRTYEQEIDFRLGAALITPEDTTEEHFENIAEAALMLARRLGPREARNPGHINNLMKLHDLEALEAFSRARSGGESSVAAGKAMLGEVIVDAVDEFMELSTFLDDADPGTYEHLSGLLAEFMYVTWERLHIFNHSDPEAVAKIFARCSLDREDYNKGFDAAILYFDDTRETPTAQAIQYKTGTKKRGGYGPLIQTMRIQNWSKVLGDIDNVVDLFGQAVLANSPAVRQDAYLSLESYFSPAVIGQHIHPNHPAAAL